MHIGRKYFTMCTKDAKIRYPYDIILAQTACEVACLITISVDEAQDVIVLVFFMLMVDSCVVLKKSPQFCYFNINRIFINMTTLNLVI